MIETWDGQTFITAMDIAAFNSAAIAQAGPVVTAIESLGGWGAVIFCGVFVVAMLAATVLWYWAIWFRCEAVPPAAQASPHHTLRD